MTPPDSDLRRVIAGAETAGVSDGHIAREALAMAACLGERWDRLSRRARLEYLAEAAEIAVGVHVA